MTPDPQDQIEWSFIPLNEPRPGGKRDERADPPHALARPWISVYFKCCHVYARIYRDHAGTKYEGRCPRCASLVRALIGPDGTSARLFEAE